MLLTWTAGALVAGGLDPSTAGGVVLGAGGAGAMLALLALALVAPSRQPARAPRDEMVMHGRLAQVVVIAVVLGLDHAVVLPTVAVVLALASMAVHLAGITLVHARLDSPGAGHRRASTDELTGPGNRRVLTEALAGVDAGGPLALVLLDLDRFTGVNGAVGQHAGDELLRQAESALAEAVHDASCPGSSSLRSYDAQADAAHRDEGALVADPQTSRRVLAALTALLGLGVDVTQGYHHGRPLPAADVVRWAAARSRAAQVAR